MKYYQEHKLICWWPDGAMGSDDLMAYFEKLGNCEWGHEANRFCDFSRVSDFEFSQADLRILANRRKRLLETHRDVHLVVYSKSALGFGMGRMYQTIMGEWPLEITVTQDLAKCAALLAVDTALLSPPGVESGDEG